MWPSLVYQRKVRKPVEEKQTVALLCDAGGPNFYSVSAHTRQGQRVETTRRFNDLVVLHENLKTSFRGCVIPFRPGKTFANSTAIRNHRDSFLRDRAYAIKCYLIKVTRHPDIKDSTVWSLTISSAILEVLLCRGVASEQWLT